jgi:choline kinase
MKVILLAAGLGSRLGYLTRELPKATVSVLSQPLIQRMIKFAQLVDVSDIVVVGGYNSQHLWNEIQDQSVIKVENQHFRRGNLYSLEAAKQHLDDDFVLMNIDHLYPSHLARMIRGAAEGIWAVCDFDRRLYQDDMKICIEGQLNQNACVSAISKELEQFDGGYCGMTIVRGKARMDYLTAFENVLQHRRQQAVVEDVLAELIHIGNPPAVLDISGIRWLEIDTQEDLANAERILRMKPHFLV